MVDDRSTTTLDSPTAGTGATTGTETTHPLAQTGKEAGERAGHLLERGADIGMQQADRGLKLAASGAETVAESIRRVSTDMEADQPQIAEFASTAADRAEDLATFLREHDTRQLIGNVESFARRQPWLFVGGAFVAGVAASRFFKAAGGNRGQGQWQSTGYQSGNGYGSTGSSGHWSATSGRDFEAPGPGAREEI